MLTLFLVVLCFFVSDMQFSKLTVSTVSVVFDEQLNLTSQFAHAGTGTTRSLLQRHCFNSLIEPLLCAAYAASVHAKSGLAAGSANERMTRNYICLKEGNKGSYETLASLSQSKSVTRMKD